MQLLEQHKRMQTNYIRNTGNENVWILQGESVKTIQEPYKIKQYQEYERPTILREELIAHGPSLVCDFDNNINHFISNIATTSVVSSTTDHLNSAIANLREENERNLRELNNITERLRERVQQLEAQLADRLEMSDSNADQ